MKGEYLKSELTLDDMWKRIEEYGIDCKILESTNPSSELLFEFYTAIIKLNEIHSLDNKTRETD
jgi:hypothetical protein